MIKISTLVILIILAVIIYRDIYYRHLKESREPLIDSYFEKIIEYNPKLDISITTWYKDYIKDHSKLEKKLIRRNRISSIVGNKYNTYDTDPYREIESFIDEDIKEIRLIFQIKDRSILDAFLNKCEFVNRYNVSYIKSKKSQGINWPGSLKQIQFNKTINNKKTIHDQYRTYNISSSSFNKIYWCNEIKSYLAPSDIGSDDGAYENVYLWHRADIIPAT